MKKALVVLLILAVAGGAFAEITFGGSVEGAWQVLNGISKEDKNGDPTGGALNDDGEATEAWTRFGLKDGIGNGITNTVRARLSMDAVNEDGTLGAWYQFRPTEGSIGLGNIWWQPISQFKATLGYLWGGGNLSAGVASPNDVILPIAFWGRAWGWKGDRAMHGYGWEVSQGAHIELFPMESLYIVVSVPTDQKYHTWNGEEGNKAMDTFAQTAARVAYTITDIGQIGVTWDGGTMTLGEVPSNSKPERVIIKAADYPQLGVAEIASLQAEADLAYAKALQAYDPTSGFGVDAFLDGLDPAYISAHFNLTAIENLALSVVFDVPLPVTKFYGNPDNAPDLNVQLPFTGAVQAGFTAGAFHIDGGIAAKFLGSVKFDDGDAVNIPLSLGVTLNPAYDVGIVKVGLVGEMLFTAAAEEYHPDYDRGSKVNFNILPYVQKDLAGGSIYAGVQIMGTPYTGFKDDKGDSWKTAINWSVPVGFQFYF